MATAAETKTLLEFLMDLLSDKQALADFQKDPECALKDAGLEHVSLEDIQELLPVVLEKSSPEDCAKYEDDCDEDKCHDDKWREHDDNEHHHGKHHDECDDDRGHHNPHHDYEMHKVITHLTYVTNNFTIDNSINVWNVGDGDVLIVSGDGNIIGDGNVTGDGNTIGNDNTQITADDGNVFGDGNGSGNISGELNLDLGLGGLPIDPFGAGLPNIDDLDIAGQAPLVNGLVASETEESEPTSAESESEPADENDGGTFTEVSGDGNVIGDGNVTGDGNTIGDGNTEITADDGNVFGNGNNSGNVDLSVNVDLADDEPVLVDADS